MSNERFVSRAVDTPTFYDPEGYEMDPATGQRMEPLKRILVPTTVPEEEE